ncbi:mechanosensitive ion channel [Verrucomicrobiaceae bacterium R5-34]|uniref:Mechanosensitive ion channel n=1 Tax=Oceaniferula flava TaxID=2800421 RepID=A0AAE2VAX4_9BACT|nr:mechanosensitive ion channel domain-containing protein [Oceaniferula flavus]MBK1829685.1 mechanosensitive ion channel [Verrucomicrobiaceae bacterium R5-34]MBK1853875.1 mechanosensitive ion channel [Oceaniferula flavus]MBM1135181.1 mechanosensitive ion channel [Oceaniferula flavus]
MIDLEAIKSTLFALVNDRQDYWQWAVIILCAAGGVVGTHLIRRTLFAPGSVCQKFVTRFFELGKGINGVPALTCFLLWITWSARINWSASQVAKGLAPVPSGYIYTTALLVTAFVIYQFATALSKGRAAPRLLGGAMLFIFALHLFGWLTPLSQALQNIRLPLGSIEINLWSITAGIAALFLLLWLVGLSTRFIDAVVKPRSDIPPSIKVLIGKGSRILLYFGACIWALKIGGVPLGGLAVFSGALGLGLGFGLQKVISNLVSGVIILLDKSIKPGDVIEIDGTFGWINSIRTRYISVITRDRKEILIPNEDFVTNKVVNWSFTDRIVRIKADVGVSYATDVPEAIEICKKAVRSLPRVLNDPEPNCLLMGFGDSSIDLQVRFWIDDAPQGVSNIRSEVLLAVWKAFKEHEIEIPFPQRDLHIKSGHSLTLTAPPAKDPIS